MYFRVVFELSPWGRVPTALGAARTDLLAHNHNDNETNQLKGV